VLYATKQLKYKQIHKKYVNGMR